MAKRNPISEAKTAPNTIAPPESCSTARRRLLRSGSRYNGVDLLSTRTGIGRRGVAGFIRSIAASATSARAIAQIARTATPVADIEKRETVANMTEDSVPPLEQRELSHARALYWALPLITVSWLMIFGVLVMAVVPVQRWELAPGTASRVGARIAFSAVKNGEKPPRRYNTPNSIRFVTAQTGQMTLLDSLVGWLDPHVAVETYKEHFGTQSPSSVRRLGYQMMFGAKQIAEFVAMKKLGLNAQFHDGAVLIEQLVCAPIAAPQSACKVLDVGETIVAVNGVSTATLPALVEQLAAHKIGDKVTLTVIPYGVTAATPKNEQRATRIVELMESPDTNGKAIIGFTPADTRTVNLPFNVNIATADIGGPSAGLAFTLALLDELTPGSLMGTTQVAATGTMNEMGQVGAIGALEQKAVAVRDSGAKLFLVPAGQSDEEITRARKAAGKSVEIVKVATLDEALAALAARGGGTLPVSLARTATK